MPSREAARCARPDTEPAAANAPDFFVNYQHWRINAVSANRAQRYEFAVGTENFYINIGLKKSRLTRYQIIYF